MPLSDKEKLPGRRAGSGHLPSQGCRLEGGGTAFPVRLVAMQVGISIASRALGNLLSLPSFSSEN